MTLTMRVVLLAATAVLTQAQEGHWEGSIQMPDHEVKFTADLSKNVKQEWVGQFSFIGGGPQALDLSNISVNGGEISFTLELPNKPTLKGKLQPDDNTITGVATQGGNDVKFSMKRTGEAKIVPAVPSTPLSQDMTGTWEGTVDMGKALRLIVKLTNDVVGTAAGTLVSVDQGGGELPLNSIRQEGSKLDFGLKMVNGSYKGTLADDKSEIKGDWSQNGATAPLNLKRKASEAKPEEKK